MKLFVLQDDFKNLLCRFVNITCATFKSSSKEPIVNLCRSKISLNVSQLSTLNLKILDTRQETINKVMTEY